LLAIDVAGAERARLNRLRFEATSAGAGGGAGVGAGATIDATVNDDAEAGIEAQAGAELGAGTKGGDDARAGGAGAGVGGTYVKFGDGDRTGAGAEVIAGDSESVKAVGGAITAESAGAGVEPGDDGCATIATTPPQWSHLYFDGIIPFAGNAGAGGTASPFAWSSARWHVAQRCIRWNNDCRGGGDAVSGK
jgi:hypothetical protein